jgi:formylglycine-generating enzyme required for sulfatase activity
MKKLLLLMLMPLAVLSASAQNNDYNMVIELNNGTTITLGADDVRNLTFNGESLSISGNTIDELKAEIKELRALIMKCHPEERAQEYTVNGVSFKMVWVAGGTFQMGATEEQGNDAYDREKPVHRVTLSGFSIGETEVTQELWEAVMGSNPSYFTGDSQLPVEQVSWDDCQAFIQALNTLTGRSFRLPTEAEWEFAARGGNLSQGYKYAGSNSIGDVAWYMDNSSDVTHPVGTKAPNELGLYDMSGNVFEWCQDWFGSYDSVAQTDPTGPSSGSGRVRRGGGWHFGSTSSRVSYRNGFTPSSKGNTYGFRLAL